MGTVGQPPRARMVHTRSQSAGKRKEKKKGGPGGHGKGPRNAPRPVRGGYPVAKRNRDRDRDLATAKPGDAATALAPPDSVFTRCEDCNCKLLHTSQFLCANIRGHRSTGRPVLCLECYKINTGYCRECRRQRCTECLVPLPKEPAESECLNKDECCMEEMWRLCEECRAKEVAEQGDEELMCQLCMQKLLDEPLSCDELE